MTGSKYELFERLKAINAAFASNTFDVKTRALFVEATEAVLNGALEKPTLKDENLILDLIEDIYKNIGDDPTWKYQIDELAELIQNELHPEDE